jgi:putative sigma-54 modulation protein
VARESSFFVISNRKQNMKHIHLHITPHDVAVSSRLRELLQTKISALGRFAGDILSAEVVLRGPTGAAQLCSVSARLALPGRDVQANATHANLFGAVEKLVSRLARLSRKRKTRLAKTFRRPGRQRIKRAPGVSGLLLAP